MSVTPLMEAARRGDLEGVKRNLSQVGRKDKDGETALMKAAMVGHANCIPILEKEVEIQNSDGLTALMYAAYYASTDCARLLLSEAGKQTTKGWKDFPPGMSALMIAAHRNRPEIVQLLLLYEEGLEDSEGHTAHWHAYNGSWGRDYSQVRQLLENERSERIPPPKEPLLLLMSAVARGVLGVRNTTPGHRGSWDAALMMAAYHGRPPSVLLLLPLEGAVQQPEGDGPSACTPGGPGRMRKTPGGRGGSPRRGRKNAHRGDPRACSGVA
ncbi:Ankyrin repeat protein 1 [Giardia muris]|uniref:Ankyrin repeat protein 1 n=1 Tax=Giardia muris TaxID=5742 RepID=A0A4Z1T2V2_GIAMU|nr:Ankyrin repeat protein 1 [Giardia muris]|eukprot:TNJ28273.1 Ankyrin repeat protein 1 [Giardia muris]